MKQYRGLITFIAVMVGLFVLVQIWHTKSAPEEEKRLRERQYEGVAHLMNASPPKMPDDSVRLDRITYGEGVLHIPYTLLTVTKSEIDVDRFIEERKEVAATVSCDEKGIGPLVKSGLIVNYTFSDSSNSSIADFKIAQSDCK